MPLNAASLASDLEAFFKDPPVVTVGDDVDPVGTRNACAQKWATAMQSYASAIVPPSTTVSAAASAMVASLSAAFAIPGGAAPGMSTAFATFAASVGLGMAGFVPIPPPAPINFAPLGLIQPPTHAAAAQSFATLIDAWMHTGIATLVAPPNTPQPWA